MSETQLGRGPVGVIRLVSDWLFPLVCFRGKAFIRTVGNHRNDATCFARREIHRLDVVGRSGRNEDRSRTRDPISLSVETDFHSDRLILPRNTVELIRTRGMPVWIGPERIFGFDARVLGCLRKIGVECPHLGSGADSAVHDDRPFYREIRPVIAQLIDHPHLPVDVRMES